MQTIDEAVNNFRRQKIKERLSDLADEIENDPDWPKIENLRLAKIVREMVAQS